jgi:uncharacterized protein
MRREVLSWLEVESLIDHIIPQFKVEFDAMIIITRGGLVFGGILADQLNINTILTAAVDFPAEIQSDKKKTTSRLMVWPKFLQFPEDQLLRDQHVLVVDDVWGSGRTITAVKNRISAAGGMPYTCVLHFNPYRNIFEGVTPTYYAAITDAYIVYPWEVDRGKDGMILRGFPNE